MLWLLSLFGCARPEQGNLAVTVPPKPAGPIFFVATNGNDRWSGALATPARNKQDGPFASLPRALEAVRASRKEPNAGTNHPATIFVRRGSYFLSEPLVLKPEDSDLTLSAYGDEKPVISGGRPIAGWKEVSIAGKNLWAADIPEARDGKWFFHQLWINGKRAVRARHPNHGYLGVAELLDKGPEWTQGHTRFRFREGDLKAWKTVSNAEVIVMTRWVESRLPVLSVDESNRTVSFGKRSVFELAPKDPYYLEHAFELLDEPGEWYLERGSGTLYYLPRPGERLNQIETIAPALTQVLRFEGRPEAAQFVERVRLRGLAFSHTEWYFPDGFHSSKSKPQISPEPKPEVGGFGQAAVGVPGAVWGEGACDCLFEGCSFSHLGNYGLELARGCRQARISQCEFSDLGAGGLKLGETAIRENEPEQTRGNEISDCHIHDGGKMFHSAVGLWIGQSPDNRITHNLIHDFYYTGISIGWTWGYGKSLATNNLIAFNHIHHIGIKSDGDGPILSDMGGIYTLGNESGTRIVNNLWHDIAGHSYGGWGIYFDEGTSGILAESNLVYRTTHGGFHQHYGETNLVCNNIFAFGRDQQIQRSRVEPHISFSFLTNIVYYDSGSLRAGDWPADTYKMDWNLYFDVRPPDEQVAAPGGLIAAPSGRAPSETLPKADHDRHSLVADPLFLSPQQNDFRLQPDSPAFKIGFQPIDLAPIGIRGRPR